MMELNQALGNYHKNFGILLFSVRIQWVFFFLNDLYEITKVTSFSSGVCEHISTRQWTSVQALILSFTGILLSSTVLSKIQILAIWH